MPTLTIDNETYTFEDTERNLLDICLSFGLNLPFFCWHPAMHSVGACRQCAVKVYKDEHDTHGRIMMSCTTRALDGMRISINDPEVVAFRAQVISWMMVNHPHDCPVCDEGGECHLQDMTVMTGHTYRDYRFRKRTYCNQHLGPFINHEMNRCIQCYRCVRFYRHYAGGRDFNVFGAHDMVYFGRPEDGVLESEFSGNLVEVCPTGVFTDKTFKRHYTRKWDLQTAPSICAHCGLGCNTIPGERYGILRRVRNRFHFELNGHFICDRGRFGYEYVNSPLRIREPLLTAVDSTQQPATVDETLAHARTLLQGTRVIGIGSPRASLEANFALRELVGADNFCHGMPRETADALALQLQILRDGSTPSATMREVEEADAIFVLGEDLHATAPRLALAAYQALFTQPREGARALGITRFDDTSLREVIQDARGPAFIATPAPTKLDAEATAVYRAAPDDLARLALAVAHAIDGNAPAVANLPEETATLARQIADALLAAQRPAIISGPSLDSPALLQAAANVAWALTRAGRDARLALTTPAPNSLGLAMLGGMSLEEAVAARQRGSADTVVVLENDLARMLPAEQLHTLLGGQTIVLDALAQATTARADVVLPTATVPEADGTFINYEGRAQRFFQVFVPEGQAQESWRWLAALMPVPPDWSSLDEVIDALARALPAFAAIREVAPGADFRMFGRKIARQPHRMSGRTAMYAHKTVHEPPPPADPDTPLAFTMEGYYGTDVPAPLLPRIWAPGWNSEQALHKFQHEVGGPLIGGPAGIRLFAPGTRKGYFTGVPAAFTPRTNSWLALPAYHIFGSEELSQHTPGVAERAPRPYVALSAHDAERLALLGGSLADVTIDGCSYTLPVQVQAELPDGMVLMPCGLSALPGLALPATATVRPAEGGAR